MTANELIVKQQLEIEGLKETIIEYKDACKEARNELNYPEQWSVKCLDFPKVAMNGIIRARQAIESVQ